MICYHKGKIREVRSGVGRGITLIEVLVATVILSVMITAALTSVAGSKQAEVKANDLTMGTSLAESLINEILAHPYEDPDGSPTFGRESGESATVRSEWDDVDDYESLSQSPPTDRAGVDIADASAWTRAVAIEFVNPNNPKAVIGTDLGVKRIVVTVSRGNRFAHTLTAIRTSAWQGDTDELRVLIVVDDPTNPSVAVRNRAAMFSEWGFMPTLVSASASEAALDEAAKRAEAFYIPQETSAASVGSKLRDATIGIVSEHPSLTDELGISSINPLPGLDIGISITSVSHAITSGLGTGLLSLFSTGANIHTFTLGGLASGSQTLANGTLIFASHVTIDTGGALAGGGNAAARRVQLPFGTSAFGTGVSQASAHRLVYRSVVWAAEGDL